MSAAVSVVIPVLDDAERLDRCLATFARQTFTLPFEVIVVDSGSSDDPGAVVAGYEFARLIEEPKPCDDAARNRGARDSRGEVLAFTDADCLPEATWLERGYAHARAAIEPAFVTGRIAVFPRDADAPTAAERFDMLHASFAVTSNLFVHWQVFERIGPFRDDLAAAADLEWRRSAGEHGVQAVHAEDVAVLRPARRSLGSLTRTARRAELAQWQFSLRQGRRQTLASAVGTLLRPPLRTIAANMRRSGPAYATYALLVFYAGAIERLRLVL